MGCGGSNNSSQLLQQNQQLQKSQNIAVGRVKDAFAGYTPDFYNRLAQSYVDYQMPALQQQYQNALNQVDFKMAGQGLDKSSQSQKALGQLSDTMKQGQIQLGQQGQTEAAKFQQQVANQEAQLMQMAMTANNPGQIANQAGTWASSMQAPSSFAPLGAMFNNVLGGLAGGQSMAMGNQLSAALQPYLNNYSLGGGSFIPRNS